MPIELRILSGARAGQGESFEKSVIAIGRHPLSDFRFDPKQDLDVSARHGEIRLVGSHYAILDSNSTNGTFVNGKRVPPGGSLELNHNDIIAFGAQGPTVSVSVRAQPAAPVLAPSAGAPPLARAAGPVVAPPSGTPLNQTSQRPSGGKPRRNTAERVAIAVAQQTRRLWLAIIGIVLILGGTAAALYMKSSRESEASRVKIGELLAANEAIAKGFQDRLKQGDTVLANRMRHINDSLVQMLRQAKSAPQMAAAEAALRKHSNLQRQITEMDYSAIVAANDPAVVLIASEVGGSATIEATGFCVRASGLIVTNRHVVIDSVTRSAATGIRVKFANSGRTYRAHVVKVPESATTDLALIQVDEGGKFATISSLAPAGDVSVGAPVSVIGYPLGADLPMDGSAAKTTATFGNVSKVVPDVLQIDAYATHGSSGSPVFDAHGHVVGIVSGGVGDRIVFSVPVDRLHELLRGVK
jgi:S1-C subfamily serine protease